MLVGIPTTPYCPTDLVLSSFRLRFLVPAEDSEDGGILWAEKGRGWDQAFGLEHIQNQSQYLRRTINQWIATRLVQDCAR